MRQLIRKLKIVFDIIRTSLRKRNKPVLLHGELTSRLHCVKFLGSPHDLAVVIYCLKSEYWHYDGRTYRPSGFYKSWILWYQDPNTPTAVIKGTVVYPSAHQMSNIEEHYIAYLGTIVA